MGAAVYPSVDPFIIVLQMIAELTILQEIVIRQTENTSQFYTTMLSLLFL